jgi:asparagine synthase (glutamine-hydrolysing)
MCGVVGWVDFRDGAAQDGATRDRRAILDAMVATMRNRGPDGAGTWLGPHCALGQRRLAVIDVEGGSQPMTGSAGPGRPPVVLVHAGEIYNFRELRAELAGRGHPFVTRSDTEVLLRAYLEWGDSCVTRLEGMFGFALWDEVRETLLLARDRLGVKPLYYAPRPAGVLFGSEPKGVFAHPSFQPEVDEQMLPILLNPRLALPGETPLRGLRELPAGHLLLVDRAGCHERRYWGLVSQEHADDLPATVRTVRSLLADAVSRQLVADVEVGTLLSGGLDSTMLTALAARDHDGPLSTFAVDFAGDERDFRPTPLRPERDAPYAALAAKHLGTDHHHVLLDPKVVWENTEAPLRARDLPTHGQFDGSAHLLFRAVRQRVTVALSGEGADELFGGYPWLHRPDIVWRDTFPWLGDAPRLTDCLAPDVRVRVRPREAELDRYTTLRARVPRLPGESGLDARMREVLFFGLHGPLAYLLDAADRLSMSVGLEVRVPFCDHRLLEYVWNIPWSLKSADGREKSVLRLAADGLVPPGILTRAKSGYPAMHTPAQDAMVRRAVHTLADDPTSPLYGRLDVDRIRAIAEGADTTLTHVSAAHLLAPLLEVDRWIRAYRLVIR